jgi:hypothetical protein
MTKPKPHKDDVPEMVFWNFSLTHKGRRKVLAGLGRALGYENMNWNQLPGELQEELKERWGYNERDQMDKLIAWFKAEYARRTAAIKTGKGRIDWLDPGTRISWSEVLAKADELGIDTRDPVNLRLQFAAEMMD